MYLADLRAGSTSLASVSFAYHQPAAITPSGAFIVVMSSSGLSCTEIKSARFPSSMVPKSPPPLILSTTVAASTIPVCKPVRYRGSPFIVGRISRNNTGAPATRIGPQEE